MKTFSKNQQKNSGVQCNEDGIATEPKTIKTDKNYNKLSQYALLNQAGYRDNNSEITSPSLPVSPASPLNFLLAQDDLKNAISHLYYSKALSAGFSEELAELGRRYGFEIRPEPSMYFWTEDNMWLSSDGFFAFQPQIPLVNKARYHHFVTALDLNIAGAEEEGHHSLGDNDSQGLYQEILNKANNLVSSRGLQMFKTLSVIDGGNMLTGQRADGQPYVLVGRDAVLQTTLVHNYLDKERIAVRLETMQINDRFKLKLVTQPDIRYKEEQCDFACSHIVQEGYDPEIDLILLEAAGLVPQGLRGLDRLVFAQFARAKSHLAFHRGALAASTEFGNQMLLSQDQITTIENRYQTLHGGSLPESFNMLNQLKEDYGLLVAAQRFPPFYTDVLIDKKLSMWQPDSAAIDRMVVMLKRGFFIRSSLADQEAKQQAVRFLAMNEISKDIMADELNVPRNNLVIISQPEFHIDMCLRPLSDGRVLMQDYEQSQELIQRVLSEQSSDLTEKNKIDLQQTLLNLEQSHQQRRRITTLIHQQLQDAGLEVIKTPGVFSVGGRKVNYMNGIMGTSSTDNKMFYITNASSIEALNSAFSRWIQDQQYGLKVDFVGRAQKDGYDLNNAEFLLNHQGGFDCITLHHGTVSSEIHKGRDTGDSTCLHNATVSGHSTIADVGGRKERLQSTAVETTNLLMQKKSSDVVFLSDSDEHLNKVLVNIKDLFLVLKNRIERLWMVKYKYNIGKLTAKVTDDLPRDFIANLRIVVNKDYPDADFNPVAKFGYQCG